MSVILKIAFALVMVALGAGTGYCWYGWSLTQQNLYSTQVELASTQASLGSHQQELSVTKGELASTMTQLETAQSRLSRIETELQVTNNELQDTKDYLSTVEAKLEATEARLASIQSDVLHLHNPTLEEVLDFLREDKTDANEYVEGGYICAHFASQVNNNAESRGIRCAYVDIRYPKLAHAIIAFETVDEGMVYFDAISDERVRPEIGKEYWRCVEPKPGRQYQKPDYDDTIREIIVIW